MDFLLPPAKQIVFSLLFGLAVLLPAEAVARDAWGTFGGPTGRFLVENLPEKLPSAPDLLWKIPVKGQSYGPISADRDLVIIPDHDKEADYFYALDPATGDQRWVHRIANGEEMDFGASPRAMPLLLEDKVIVLNAWGRLQALDRKDGSVLWQVDFRDDFNATVPEWGFCSTPIVVPKGIVTNPGGSEGGIVCLDPADGSVVWKAPTGRSNYAGFLHASFNGVDQIITYDADALVSVNPASGEELWSFKTKATSAYICPAPVKIGEHLLLVDQDNAARLFAMKDGRLQEPPVAVSTELAAELSTPVELEGRIYFFYHGLYCSNAEDLKVLSENTGIDALAASAFGYPFVDAAGKRMLLYTEDGSLLLLDLSEEEMKVLSQIQIAGKGQICPALVGGVIYVRDDEKGAYAYRLW